MSLIICSSEKKRIYVHTRAGAGDCDQKRTTKDLTLEFGDDASVDSGQYTVCYEWSYTGPPMSVTTIADPGDTVVLPEGKPALLPDIHTFLQMDELLEGEPPPVPVDPLGFHRGKVIRIIPTADRPNLYVDVRSGDRKAGVIKGQWKAGSGYPWTDCAGYPHWKIKKFNAMSVLRWLRYAPFGGGPTDVFIGVPQKSRFAFTVSNPPNSGYAWIGLKCQANEVGKFDDNRSHPDDPMRYCQVGSADHKI